MDSIIFAEFRSVFSLSGANPTVQNRTLPSNPHVTAGITNSAPAREGTYNVGEFMTRKEQLHVVRDTTIVDKALDTLVEKSVTGFPVVDDDWKLAAGNITPVFPNTKEMEKSFNLLKLDTNLFPVADSTWKTFNEVQKLLGKTNGKVVCDVMTPTPLVVCENKNLEDAARLLLKTKYRRLPVVDVVGKLIGIITRGDVVRAALQIKQAAEII
ncbi:CBS domain-containing protein CBSX1, chloroplastic-like [Salvia divinorum]|uniref:CBS domain-containing protein CBSX1, chloroplastic-like n=1 Tax=Salvia divinorum TaxID=28513 RepID=A0ABD1GJK1_SALDI